MTFVTIFKIGAKLLVFLLFVVQLLITKNKDKNNMTLNTVFTALVILALLLAELDLRLNHKNKRTCKENTVNRIIAVNSKEYQKIKLTSLVCEDVLNSMLTNGEIVIVNGKIELS